ncbi:MAG: efflux RND transporter periplasmic adaptor subunit [Candidatus Margulisiibacteriota bacterium]|jgi:multidrug efflux system membrane fusion protein
MKNLFLTLSIMVLGFSLIGCNNKKPEPEMVVPILAGKVVQKNFPVSFGTVGTTEAHKVVNVYSQVEGILVKFCVKQGQNVKKGDVLCLIDSTLYKEKVRESEADLISQKALLDYYEKEAKRYTFLYQKGAVAKSDYDKAASDYENQKNIVLSNKAMVEQNRTKLGYCAIYAPLTGKVGAYLVHEGAVISAQDTKIINISEIKPIYVSFSIPGSYVSLINKYNAQKNLKIVSYLATMPEEKREGNLVFVNNAIDPVSGLINLKAFYPNPDEFFWPGQFLQVEIFITTIKNAIVVPFESIQVANNNQFVFVVKPDSTIKKVIIDLIKNSSNEAVVEGDLKAGDMVVTDGFLNLIDGCKVKIQQSL